MDTVRQHTFPDCKLRIHKVQQCYVYLSTNFSDSLSLPTNERQVLNYIEIFLVDEMITNVNENFTSEGWRHLLVNFHSDTFYFPMDLLLLAYRKYVSLYPDDKEIRKEYAYFLSDFGPEFDNESNQILAELEALDKENSDSGG